MTGESVKLVSLTRTRCPRHRCTCSRLPLQARTVTQQQHARSHSSMCRAPGAAAAVAPAKTGGTFGHLGGTSLREPLFASSAHLAIVGSRARSHRIGDAPLPNYLHVHRPGLSPSNFSCVYTHLQGRAECGVAGQQLEGAPSNSGGGNGSGDGGGVTAAVAGSRLTLRADDARFRTLNSLGSVPPLERRWQQQVSWDGKETHTLNTSVGWL